MDFCEANKLMLAGGKVTRPSWDKGTYLHIHYPEDSIPYVCKRTAEEEKPWLGVHSHLDAHHEDWIEVS